MNAKKKHICFFNSHKAWGGGEKWHYETSMQIAKKGYSILFFANKQSSLYEKIRQASFHIKPISIKNLSFLNPFKVIYIALLLRHYNVHTIIIALPSDVKTAGLAAKIAGVEKIIYRRGTALAVKNSLLNRFLFGNVLTDIIANSQEIKKCILQRNPEIIAERKVHVIYNGLNINGQQNYPAKKRHAANRKIILGNAGRLVTQKGQVFLIYLADRLRKNNIPFEIRIAGDGQLRGYLKRLVQEMHLTEHVFFYNFVQDIYAFLSELDIFLFPSLHEGSSNVLLEAMAMHKPVVAFRVSSIPEIIVHNQTGLLARFKDVDDYYAKVSALIDDAGLRKRLGANAQDIIKKRFNHSRQVDEMLAIIEGDAMHVIDSFNDK